MDFKKVLLGALKLDPNIKSELAKEFEVSTSIVECWASGVASPHPILQEEILKFLRNYNFFSDN